MDTIFSTKVLHSSLFCFWFKVLISVWYPAVVYCATYKRFIAYFLQNFNTVKIETFSISLRTQTGLGQTT